ncbi:MAG: NAD-dependent epimerase/dehydratase family protein, partial [Polyangiales bacterium]
MIDWDPTTPVYVAGTRTLLGAACRRRLLELGFTRVGPDQTSEPAPTDAAAVRGWLLAERPRALVCAAGDSGGIGKNTRLPADLMIDNLRVLTALLPAALEAGVPRLLYLGSS